MLLSLFLASVICVPNSDGSWTCSGDGGNIDIPGVVVTNGVGICTNCTSISVEECLTFKSRLKSQVSNLRETVMTSLSNINDAGSKVQGLLLQGDSFVVNNYDSMRSEIGSDATVHYIQNTPQYNYILNYNGSTTTSGVFNYGGSMVNSIYRYYNEAVKPTLSIIDSDLKSSYSVLNESLTNLRSLDNFIDTDLTCVPCELSIGSGGGGSGSGGSGGGITNCACSEQLLALLDVVNTIRNRTENIDYNVAQILKIINSFKDQVHNDFTAISNLVYRIDSYVQTDLDKYARDIVASCRSISNELVSVQRQLYQSFKRANAFETDQGVSFDIFDLVTNEVRGVYEELNWFSRVELLLAKLALDDSEGDTTNIVHVANAEDLIQSVKDLSNDLDFTEGATKLELVRSRFLQALGKFSQIFDSVNPPQELEVWRADSESVFSFDLVIPLNSTLLSSVRAISILLVAGIFLGSIIILVFHVFTYVYKHFMAVVKIFYSTFK